MVRAADRKARRTRCPHTVEAAILEAFEQAGGANYLRRIASSDPRTFCTLLGNVLPMQLTSEDSGPVVINCP